MTKILNIIVDNIIGSDSDENTTELVENYVKGILSGICVVENNGIGAYEYAGQKSYDHGNDYAVFEDVIIAVDISSRPEPIGYEEEFDSVRKTTNITLAEKDYEVEWEASFDKIVKDKDKRFAIFNVKYVN